MRFASRTRAALIALAAIAGVAATSSARADEGYIEFSVLKAGWVIGGSGGQGMLHFRGRNYPLSIGGISGGIVFGASETRFRGRVYGIHSPCDVQGGYVAGGAGAAVGVGVQGIVLHNEKGAELHLIGHQVGLQVNADLSGFALSVAGCR
ncbi:MAG TPA: hypothetical protein VKX28_30840 [Xanthobacteraceae bacterium]|nr:hypothetical protein [Xanthobacteraceae bacterium]